MNYKQLKEICETNKILMKDLAESISMTPAGLLSAFDKQTLPIKSVLPLCEYLGMDPNKFFGVETNQAGDVIHGSQNKYGRKQIISENPETIRILRDQLAAKDEQIKTLLELLKTKQP